MEEKSKVNPSEQQSSQLISDSTSSSQKSKTMYVITGVFLLVLVICGVYLFLSKKNPTQPTSITQQTTQITPIPSNQSTPEVTPITSANVDQTLNNTDTKMQQSIDQANSDLNSINNIDKSQDSTSGL